MTYHERKAVRKKYYENFVFGWKNIKCIACNGSGFYDHNNAPKCASCDGEGKIKVSPAEYEEDKKWRAKLENEK